MGQDAEHEAIGSANELCASDGRYLDENATERNPGLQGSIASHGVGFGDGRCLDAWGTIG